MSPVEWRADAAVHALSVAFGVAACAVLTALVLPAEDGTTVAALGLYAVGMLAMFGCSALYNLVDRGGPTSLLRRLDHAAIFVMIAGSYTPFAVVALGGGWGTALLVAVWGLAVVGAVLKLAVPRRVETISIALYLGLGWIVLLALPAVIAAVSPAGLALLAAGGVIYSVGTIFYRWQGLRFGRVVWHAFVLAGAACHYAAVLREIVPRA
jgi:hemolysin III